MVFFVKVVFVAVVFIVVMFVLVVFVLPILPILSYGNTVFNQKSPLPTVLKLGVPEPPFMRLGERNLDKVAPLMTDHPPANSTTFTVHPTSIMAHPPDIHPLSHGHPPHMFGFLLSGS